MKKKLSVVVITLTPFDAEGRLDVPEYRRQLRRLRDAGVSVYVAGSATSEGYTLTPDELDQVLAISVEELKGRVPFRAMGCEPRVPREMIAFMRQCERAGVDAAQIFSLDMGHGNTPSPAELEAYYSSVIESTSLPIYLSSHRSAGYFLSLDLVQTLVERFPQIAGIAYGGPDVTYLAELIARVGDRIEVHCAGPGNALASLGLGGNGFMGGEGNFMPSLVQSVIEAFRLEDVAGVRTAFAQLMAFTTVYNRHGGSTMRGLKPLMNVFGLPGGTLRPPRIAISDTQRDVFVQQVLKLDLAGLPELAASAGIVVP